MANETIYGCVDWTTGEITFTDTTDCEATFTNVCVNWSGIHAGQVQAYHPYCDDTYYSCVDRLTGKFKIVIPDDCCPIDCEHCEIGETPQFVDVSFDDTTNFINCGCDAGLGIEYSWSLPSPVRCTQTEIQPCVWVYNDPDYASSEWVQYILTGCDGPCVSRQRYDLSVIVSRTIDTVSVTIKSHRKRRDKSCGTDWDLDQAEDETLYSGSTAVITDCVNCSVVGAGTPISCAPMNQVAGEPWAGMTATVEEV